MERRLEEYRTLLESAVRQPDCRISDLPLLPEDERQRVLVEWNRTDVDYPRDVRLDALISQQAVRTGERVAVESEDATLSYRELDARANQLAHWLQGQGVGRGDRVGLVLERSIEMVVGLLGVLKAGAAYVPLDPEYPRERLEFMLQDSRAAILLTQERLRPQLPMADARTVCLDAEWSTIASESANPVEVTTDAGDPAYVIYTSGSTGKPKGAMNAHRGIVNRLLWMQEQYGLGADDRVLQKTPFSFDVSVWEFFWPLLAGARAGDGPARRAPGPRLSAADDSRRSDHDGPLRAVDAEGLPRRSERRELRVAASGDLQRRGAVSGDQTIASSSGWRCGLHNLYGPTEAAVDVTFWQCPAAIAAGWCRSAAQWPTRGCTCSTLTSSRCRSACRVSFTSAACRWVVGYLGRPELTAERFIADPFSQDPGARLYKTGDLGRWLSDGDPRVPRPPRQPGQGPWPPDRAGGDRGGTHRPRRDRSGRSCVQGDAPG